MNPAIIILIIIFVCCLGAGAISLFIFKPFGIFQEEKPIVSATDDMYSEWSEWDQICPTEALECVNWSPKQQTRTRTCNSAPSDEVIYRCDGILSETRDCEPNILPCPNVWSDPEVTNCFQPMTGPSTCHFQTSCTSGPCYFQKENGEYVKFDTGTILGYSSTTGTPTVQQILAGDHTVIDPETIIQDS